jgi:hypothetical protein
MKKLLLLIVFIILCMHLSHAQSEKFKALFMYNFTKYIVWPSSARQGDFIIAVLGNSPMTKELEIIAGKQKVGSQNILVKTFNSIDVIDNCNILFVPAAKSSSIAQIIEKVSGKSVLIVTDKEGLASQGACINYVKDGDRIKYELNKKNIEKRGLIVNSSLVTLGILVN